MSPIFVLAPPRSFTSVFCGALGQHPELFGVPELNLFQIENMQDFQTGPSEMPKAAQLIWRLRGREGLLRTVAQLYSGEQTIDSIEMAERWTRVRADRSTRDVYHEVCNKILPLRLMDKSPAYTSKSLFLDRIIGTFPNARFIHLIRHPRGQCESVMRMRGFPIWTFFQNAIDRSVHPPVVDPQILWHDMHVRILRFLDRVPRDQWLRVQGEAFMSNVDGVLKGVCGWLGVSTSKDAIHSMKHPENSFFAHVGPPNALYGNDPNYLKSPELRPYIAKDQSLEGPVGWRPDGKGFHPRVIEMAQKLGYN